MPYMYENKRKKVAEFVIPISVEGIEIALESVFGF